MINSADLPVVQELDAASTPAPERRMAVQGFISAEPLTGFGELTSSVDSALAGDTVAEPITLDQAKAHLRVVVADDDDDILGMIVAARQMAEGRLNRTLVQRQLVDAFEPGAARFSLRKPPIVSIDSVSYYDPDRAQTTLSGADFYLATVGDTAQMRPTPGAAWPQVADQVVVTYTAGYDAGQVPMPIIRWMLLVIGTMYENRETMSSGVQVYGIPDDFMKWLLQPYMVYE